MRRNEKLTSRSLLAAAAVQAVLGAWYWAFHSGRAGLTLLEDVFVLSAPLYAALAAAALRLPSVSALSALYVNLLLFVSLDLRPGGGLTSLRDGRLLEFPILALISVPVLAAAVPDSLGHIRSHLKPFIRFSFYLLGVLIAGMVLLNACLNLNVLAGLPMPADKLMGEVAKDWLVKARLNGITGMISASILTICVIGLASEWAKRPRRGAVKD
jgi:hypothetical protein